ncbi:conserved hypothetical protein [Histoplasma capsulatum var. duboisii H88]|uniref:DUF7704 domain-containing protein n=1 Tax=Ajellomyces capsulatus (strain H88) TaxID=544711 RepID=F0U834_AJEC8|nr:conserved hypothetical protein [Histoplasma capsulatum var. duboisii H88]QSS51923.1 hypothetical protein I7I53_07383 [Histoplasma capsulatum var. duboisii H88]
MAFGMTTILPLWPHILFAILEPISLVAGCYFAIFNTTNFVAGQTPKASSPTELSLSTQAIAYQLGNIFLLLATVGVAVLYSTSEPKMVRNYLIVLAIADLGHIFSVYWCIGFRDLINVWEWNDLLWGNVGASVILFVNRIAYLLGAFGHAKSPNGTKKTQ